MDMCGPKDTRTGMAQDTCGFPDVGFARRALVRCGYPLSGCDKEMDGYFDPGIGDDDDQAEKSI